jgi:hypothetical protein
MSDNGVRGKTLRYDEHHVGQVHEARWGGVRPFVTSATIRPIVPATGMADGYAAFGGTRIGSGNRSTRANSGPVPLCPLQVPHDVTWDRTRAAAVRSRRLKLKLKFA